MKILKYIAYYTKIYLFSSESFIIRYLFSMPTFIVTVFLLLFILLNNPFSSYSSSDTVRHMKPVQNITQSDVNNTNKVFYDKKTDRDVFISSIEANSYSIKRIDGWKIKGSPLRKKEQLLEIEPHPLPPMVRTNDPTSENNNSLLILGTLKNKKDFLSVIIKGSTRSFMLSIYTLISFMITGLTLGILLGYYDRRLFKWKFFSFRTIVGSIQKLFESTPLILWVFLAVIFIEFNFKYLSETGRQNLSFIMFGIFSSPALSKMISSKMMELKAEEFVTALKLQGIPDYKIIFKHIIKYYCISILLLQSCYIVAQALFLDITLNVLKFGFLTGLGAKVFPIFSGLTGNFFHLIVVIVVEYSFIYTFYNIGRFIENRWVIKNG